MSFAARTNARSKKHPYNGPNPRIVGAMRGMVSEALFYGGLILLILYLMH